MSGSASFHRCGVQFLLKKILSLMSVNELFASGNNLPKQLLTIGKFPSLWDLQCHYYCEERTFDIRFIPCCLPKLACVLPQ